MSGTPQIFDAPPPLDLEESRRVFSAATFQRLIELVTPKLRAGKRTLVHILPASSRIAHIVMEPWALSAIYGDEFDEIIVIIRDRRLLPYGLGPHALASTVVTFVETTNDLIIKLGHYDAPRMENGPLCVQLKSAPELMKDFWRHIRATGSIQRLNLPPALEERSGEFLGGLGLAPDDKIVTLHMREHGYLASHRYHNYRNVTPARYEPAVEHLLDQGHWVFRLGDKTSNRFGIDHPRFVDLPFLRDYEDFMDVVVLSKARFALSCSSGPEVLARAFGTPTLMVNTTIELLPFRIPGDVIQFKRYIDEKTGQSISYRDALDRGIGLMSTFNEHNEQNIRLEENSSEEILASVREMEARLQGSFDADPAIDAAFQTTNEDFLATLGAPEPGTEHNGASEPYFGMVLPWTTISHSYCRANPWFLGI